MLLACTQIQQREPSVRILQTAFRESVWKWCAVAMIATGLLATPSSAQQVAPRDPAVTRRPLGQRGRMIAQRDRRVLAHPKGAHHADAVPVGSLDELRRARRPADHDVLQARDV